MQPTPQVHIPHRLESAGVDWVTSTAKSPEGRSGLMELARIERRHIIETDGEIETSVRLGYAGWQSRGFFFGSREDSTMVVASGGDATRLFPLLSKTADNITRLDVQVTVRLLDGPANLAAQGRAMLQRDLPRKVQPKSYTLIEQHPYGASLNVNKRISDSYARLYDKASEEGIGAPATRWRYEVEYKRGGARTVANYLRGSDAIPTAAEALVWTWFSARGVAPIWDLMARSENLNPTPRLHSPDVLLWFEQTLSKTVRKAARKYGLDRVITSLGLRDLVEAELQERRPIDASGGHPLSLALEDEPSR